MLTFIIWNYLDFSPTNIIHSYVKMIHSTRHLLSTHPPNVSLASKARRERTAEELGRQSGGLSCKDASECVVTTRSREMDDGSSRAGVF